MSDDRNTGDFVEHTRALGRDAQRVAEDLSTIYHTASERVNIGQLYRDNPYAVLGVAAGVGYVLGGGLFTPFTSRLLKIGARFVVLPVIVAQLEGALPNEKEKGS